MLITLLQYIPVVAVSLLVLASLNDAHQARRRRNPKRASLPAVLKDEDPTVKPSGVAGVVFALSGGRWGGRQRRSYIAAGRMAHSHGLGRGKKLFLSELHDLREGEKRKEQVRDSAALRSKSAAQRRSADALRPPHRRR